MSATKTFPTLLVLTLATGTALLNTNSSALHELIEHLAGGPVFTHQIMLLRDESEAAAKAAVGDAFRPIPEGNGAWKIYAEEMVALLGETMDIAPAAKPFHRSDAVMADAIEMMGGDASKVAVIGLGED